VNIGAANHMDTFGKRISPQVIQEIRFSACRGRKLQARDGVFPASRRESEGGRTRPLGPALSIDARMFPSAGTREVGLVAPVHG
jgi:hypothetical protein